MSLSVNKNEQSHFATVQDDRPMSHMGKMISLVPDREPTMSPSLDYSKAVHLTSNFNDQDPGKILERLERNKLLQEKFDVQLVT